MHAFLVFCGILSLVLLPFLSYLFVVPRLKNINHKQTLPFFSLLPGACVLALAAYIKTDRPIEISKACGTVQFYKTYSLRHDHFKRIAILFDGGQYNRHLRFDEHIDRKRTGEQVCFEYLDKFKNPDLAESKILNWRSG
ncbi:hypothetical protein [Acinetobacter sp.]|jgi:hypothetical protein|uniref:hypothetical protein n=1 Tax=Acinetobacter sp. TaxID=472 RepID=UPI0035AEC828